MPSFDPAILLLQLGFLLALAFLLGRLAERVGLPATTGELATGLLLGPSVLGAVATANGPRGCSGYRHCVTPPSPTSTCSPARCSRAPGT